MGGMLLGFRLKADVWIQLILATPVVLWGGWPFFKRGWASLINRSLNMFTLIAVGTGVAYWYSVIGTFLPGIFPASFRGQHGEVGDHLAQIYEKKGEKEKAIQMYAQALAGYKPLPETRARLAALLGPAAPAGQVADKSVKKAASKTAPDKAAPETKMLDLKIDGMVEKARAELDAQRTIGMGRLLKESAQADFYLVLGPGARVEEARFISGSDKLKPFVDALRAAKVSFSFPDATPPRLLRRGTLSCPAAGDCKLVLTLADDLSGAQ